MGYVLMRLSNTILGAMLLLLAACAPLDPIVLAPPAEPPPIDTPAPPSPPPMVPVPPIGPGAEAPEPPAGVVVGALQSDVVAAFGRPADYAPQDNPWESPLRGWLHADGTGYHMVTFDRSTDRVVSVGWARLR